MWCHYGLRFVLERLEGGMVNVKSQNRAKPLIPALRTCVWGIQNAQDHCLTRHWTRDMPLASPFKKYDSHRGGGGKIDFSVFASQKL